MSPEIESKKQIKFQSETSLIQPNHFISTEFFGQPTVGFYYTEKELVNKSVYYRLYDKSFYEIPYKCNDLVEINNARPNPKESPFGDLTYYCPKDFFYIACDKGLRGYETALSVFKCHIESNEAEYIINVTVEQDRSVVEQVTKAFCDNYMSVSRYLNGWITGEMLPYTRSFHKFFKLSKL